MLILFLRSIFLYCLIFAVIRLTGKRQLSDIQPFDLVVTLLIADLAAEPASDTAVPLVYAVVPILALFLMQRMISYLSLKNVKLRKIVCGRALIVIEKGIVVEETLKKTHYTLDDLLAQLRIQGVFSIDDVEYAIIETGGDMSIMLKGIRQQPTYESMGFPAPKTGLPIYIIEDGVVHRNTLYSIGYNDCWIRETLSSLGYKTHKEVLYLCIMPDGRVCSQDKGRGNVRRLAETTK